MILGKVLMKILSTQPIPTYNTVYLLKVIPRKQKVGLLSDRVSDKILPKQRVMTFFQDQLQFGKNESNGYR